MGHETNALDALTSQVDDLKMDLKMYKSLVPIMLFAAAELAVLTFFLGSALF